MFKDKFNILKDLMVIRLRTYKASFALWINERPNRLLFAIVLPIIAFTIIINLVILRVG